MSLQFRDSLGLVEARVSELTAVCVFSKSCSRVCSVLSAATVRRACVSSRAYAAIPLMSVRLVLSCPIRRSCATLSSRRATSRSCSREALRAVHFCGCSGHFYSSRCAHDAETPILDLGYQQPPPQISHAVRSCGCSGLFYSSRYAYEPPMGRPAPSAAPAPIALKESAC
jgi:hypothetical protein